MQRAKISFADEQNLPKERTRKRSILPNKEWTKLRHFDGFVRVAKPSRRKTFAPVAFKLPVLKQEKDDYYGGIKYLKSKLGLVLGDTDETVKSERLKLVPLRTDYHKPAGGAAHFTHPPKSERTIFKKTVLSIKESRLIEPGKSYQEMVKEELSVRSNHFNTTYRAFIVAVSPTHKRHTSSLRSTKRSSGASETSQDSKKPTSATIFRGVYNAERRREEQLQNRKSFSQKRVKTQLARIELDATRFYIQDMELLASVKEKLAVDKEIHRKKDKKKLDIIPLEGQVDSRLSVNTPLDNTTNSPIRGVSPPLTGRNKPENKPKMQVAAGKPNKSFKIPGN
ncbi:unnamed protein product [Lymnaea stagnalis]|uniref:Uncharacterized protein n=1 Tax=Lymnaea stagnalis TaxID=6523 RepID=A0AAV2HRH6_LYMST